MKTIVLATSNQHKIQEFSNLLKGYKILSLKDVDFTADIDESGSTMEENAKIKAMAVAKFLEEKNEDYAVLADDSGLCVNALKGAPGVLSARYAGNHNDEENRQKVLKQMKDNIDRTAYFECALCFVDDGKVRAFVGRTYGEITTEKLGDESFGYDCIFKSSDLGKTFGEATESEKGAVSHRGRAIEKLKIYLKEKNPNFDRTLVFNKK